jgi:hypothetical protein
MNGTDKGRQDNYLRNETNNGRQDNY